MNSKLTERTWNAWEINVSLLSVSLFDFHCDWVWCGLWWKGSLKQRGGEKREECRKHWLSQGWFERVNANFPDSGLGFSGTQCSWGGVWGEHGAPLLVQCILPYLHLFLTKLSSCLWSQGYPGLGDFLLLDGRPGYKNVYVCVCVCVCVCVFIV